MITFLIWFLFLIFYFLSAILLFLLLFFSKIFFFFSIHLYIFINNIYIYITLINLNSASNKSHEFYLSSLASLGNRRRFFKIILDNANTENWEQKKGVEKMICDNKQNKKTQPYIYMGSEIRNNALAVPFLLHTKKKKI